MFTRISPALGYRAEEVLSVPLPRINLQSSQESARAIDYSALRQHSKREMLPAMRLTLSILSLSAILALTACSATQKKQASNPSAKQGTIIPAKKVKKAKVGAALTKVTLAKKAKKQKNSGRRRY